MTPQVYTGQQCVNFYYHMRGNSQGRLNVLTRSFTGLYSLPFWTRAHNFGDSWNLGQVTVKSAETNNLSYRVVFEGLVGDDWLGNIALDDVHIENRACAPIG